MFRLKYCFFYWYNFIPRQMMKSISILNNKWETFDVSTKFHTFRSWLEQKINFRFYLAALWTSLCDQYCESDRSFKSKIIREKKSKIKRVNQSNILHEIINSLSLQQTSFIDEKYKQRYETTKNLEIWAEPDPLSLLIW